VTNLILRRKHLEVEASRLDPRVEITPGTPSRTVVAHEDPHEADPRQPIAE